MPRVMGPTSVPCIPPDYGKSEGELCKRDGCCGRLVVEQEPCYCHTLKMPPCPHCEEAWLECEACDWRSDD